MTGVISTDNEAASLLVREPDAHGHAAMLLVESLIHGLIERGVLSVANAVEIVEVATEVKADIGHDLGHTPATLQKAIQLLQDVSASLRIDLKT